MVTSELITLADRHASDMATQRKLLLEVRAFEDAEEARRKNYDAELRAKKVAIHIAQAHSQESATAVQTLMAEVPKELRGEVERAEIEARALQDAVKLARIDFRAAAFDRDWLKSQPGADRGALQEASRLVAERELAVLQAEERESRHGIKLTQVKKQAAAALESLKRELVSANG